MWPRDTLIVTRGHVPAHDPSCFLILPMVLPLPGLSHHSRDGDLYNLSNCLTIIYCVRRVDGAGGMVKTCSAPVRTPLLFAQTELCHVVSRACALHTTWSHAPRGPRACALCYHLGDSIFVHQQWACRDARTGSLR